MTHSFPTRRSSDLLFENPVGLDGFEFVEFCAPEKGVLEPVFAAMGFTRIASHRSKDVHLWRQGGINLIANYEPKSAAWYFAREHGPSARSEEHTSELQELMRISYAVFCLKTP